jgi:tocopherol cyclase
MVRTPTANGLVMCCRDTLKGVLSIDLRTRQGKQIVTAASSLAGLEVGGSGWEQAWVK